jgi:hypothetical protein
MKTCTKCLEPQPLSAFHKHCRMKDGLSPRCKVCKGDTDKAWRSNNRSERINYDMKRRYAVDDCEYNARLQKQEGGCAICGNPCNTGRRLAIDHNHRTKKVRGLLCNSCNNGLGRFNDDPQRLQAAINYLTVNQSPTE